MKTKYGLQLHLRRHMSLKEIPKRQKALSKLARPKTQNARSSQLEPTS